MNYLSLALCTSGVGQFWLECPRCPAMSAVNPFSHKKKESAAIKVFSESAVIFVGSIGVSILGLSKQHVHADQPRGEEPKYN